MALDDQWRRSTRSGDNGNCVEVRRTADGTIVVRDSKNPWTGQHHFTSEQWTEFTLSLKGGLFDR